MAAAAKRSSANTDLFIGTLKAAIGLYGTNAKPAGTPDFTTAGPNGGALKYEMRGAAAAQPISAPDGAPTTSDPLGDELAAAATSAGAQEMPGSDVPARSPAR